MEDDRASITALTGVYHANGGLVGELQYVVGKLRGTAHCGLCDITHGMTGKKQSFRHCEARLPVPLTLVHLNEQTADMAAHTRGQTPCVVAQTEGALITLLDASALDGLRGSVQGFEAALEQAMQRESLRW